MHYKKLEGNKIYLSPITIDDIDKYLKWMNDKRITDNLNSTYKLINELGEKNWINRSLENNDYNFGIIDKENDELIGNCGIMDINLVHGKATLGIFIGEENKRGNGIGKEVLNLLLDYGFNQLRLHNIDLAVFDFNKQAIACYKGVGFKEYGRRRESYFVNGKWHDEILMEFLEDDYRNSRLKNI